MLAFLVKACMLCLSFSGMVPHGGRNVAENRPPVASLIGWVEKLLVYMAQNGSLSACFSMVAVSFDVWDIVERDDKQFGRRVR